MFAGTPRRSIHKLPVLTFFFIQVQVTAKSLCLGKTSFLPSTTISSYKIMSGSSEEHFPPLVKTGKMELGGGGGWWIKGRQRGKKKQHTSEQDRGSKRAVSVDWLVYRQQEENEKAWGQRKGQQTPTRNKAVFYMKICFQWPSIKLAAQPARGGREAKYFISACISFGSF